MSGDDDKQKHVSIADNNRIKIIRLRLNRRFSQNNADEALSAKRRAHGAKRDRTVDY